MDTIDRITEKILDETRQEANAIIEAAKGEADELSKKEHNEINKIGKANEERLEKELELIEKRCDSEIRQMTVQMLMQARVQVIDDVIKESENKILSMGDAEYFKAMRQMLYSVNPKKGSVIRFNRRDMERMPSSDWGNAVLDKEYADVNGGFVISFENTEENFSIGDIIEYRYDELCDMLNDFFEGCVNERH